MSAKCQERTLSKCLLCAARDVKWNMEPTGVPIRFSTGGPLLHIEFAQASVGVHNEYFLHHRRRGRCTSRCRLLGSALNNKILFDLFLINAYVRDFYPRLRRRSCFACCHLILVLLGKLQNRDSLCPPERTMTDQYRPPFRLGPAN